jgi:hypothetical protein
MINYGEAKDRIEERRKVETKKEESDNYEDKRNVINNNNKKSNDNDKEKKEIIKIIRKDANKADYTFVSNDIILNNINKIKDNKSAPTTINAKK